MSFYVLDSYEYLAINSCLERSGFLRQNSIITDRERADP